jgi:protein-S-isoprenylcysteine O-methyltransferase Ste14
MITLDALSGFAEDKRAARRFARRFWPLSLSCVASLLCFGAFLFIPLYRGHSDPMPQIYVVLAGISFAVTIVLFSVTWRRMVADIPVSQHSSKPMEVFQLQDTIKEGKYELVYLCRQSRTFFRIVFRAPGD